MSALLARLGAVVMLFAAADPASTTTVPEPTEPLAVVVPAAVEVGSSVSISVRGAIPNLPVDVIAFNGPREQHIVLVPDVRGGGSVELDEPFTDRAGMVTVSAIQGHRFALAEVYLRPGTAVDPVMGVVGGRSIVADGADHAMAVILPEDALANPLADGTGVDLHLVRPDGKRQNPHTYVGGALAWLRYHSLKVSGHTAVAMSVDRATSPVVELRETADDPVPFELEALGPDIAADARSLRVVRTGVLADKNGNVLPDGSNVVFTLDGPLGRGQSRSETVAGVATVNVPAPSEPGSVTVRAWSHGVPSSNEVTIDFAANLTAIPATARVTDEHTVTVSVGPVLDNLGGYVSDGTEVAVDALGTDGAVHRELVFLTDGVTSANLAIAKDAHTVRVTILGVAVDVDVRR